MAKDDYFVIAYKILAYLYVQLKNGDEVEGKMRLKSMKFKLTNKEICLLENKGIPFTLVREYTDDEALELLEQVRDIEVEYAQDYGTEGEKLYFQYGGLADKIQSQIPED